METALKALYWSTLVYRYDENAPNFTRDKPLKVVKPSCSAARNFNALQLTTAPLQSMCMDYCQTVMGSAADIAGCS